MVPKFSPPLFRGFVSRSPKVAAKGLVSTKAAQNKTRVEIFVK